RFHQRIGQFAIVGHQQQAFAGPVQTAYGIHTPFHFANEVHHGGTLFLIAHRGHISLGLVQHNVGVTLGAVQQFTIDEHAAGSDQVFGFAARGNSGSGDNFLQTFGWHGYSGLVAAGASISSPTGSNSVPSAISAAVSISDPRSDSVSEEASVDGENEDASTGPPSLEGRSL